MKKFLLGTTAILGVVGFAGAASADAPRVTVGGFMDFQAGYVDEDQDAGRRSHGFRNDAEIQFRVDGKTDGGLGYGAVVELETNIVNDPNKGGDGDDADRTFIYLEGDNFGRFELGGNSDAAAGLKVDASTIARATGGIDGGWYNFASIPTDGNFIVRPRLPVAHGGVVTPGETENASKITYYTPKFSGIQLGVSYTPDSGERGQLADLTDVDGDFENIFSGGINYNRQINQVALGLSATFETAEYELAGDDLESYALGANLGFAGFSLAGSWGDITENPNGEGDFWTVGAAYEYEDFGISVSYLDSSQETLGGDNDFENLSFGADYAMAPGLTPYAEVSLFEYDGITYDNDGTVFIIGTQVAF